MGFTLQVEEQVELNATSIAVMNPFIRDCIIAQSL